MTVAVTGASGHVGANLVRALLERGRRVRALVRDDTRGLAGLDIETVPGDVLDRASLTTAFDGAEVVYHLAARITYAGDPDGSVERINVEGPRNVAAACLECGVKRLVHFSSIHAFAAEPRDEVVDETRGFADRHDRRLSIYDRTKSAGQQEVLAAVERGLDAVVVNPTAILGPYDYKQSATGGALVSMLRRELPALVDGGFNWVDVRDVVAGALAAEERGRTGESYLLAGAWCSLEELGRVLEQVSGVRAPRFVTPMWLARVGLPFITLGSKLTGAAPLYTAHSLHAVRNHRLISYAKAERELGYHPRPLSETLAAACEWYRANGMV